MANWTEPKVDWVTNPKNPRAEDFNRIEGNIQFLKEDIENKKGIIIGALEDVGLSVDEVSTFAEIADAIINANQGKKIITPGTSNITIPKGFHNGEGYVVGDSDLVSSNIKKGVSIFGVTGTLPDGTTRKRYATGTAKSSGSSTTYILTVSGLSFKPSLVFAYTSEFGNDAIWQSLGINQLNKYPTKYAMKYEFEGNNIPIWNISSDFIVTSGGFSIPMTVSSSQTVTIYWIAIE